MSVLSVWTLSLLMIRTGSPAALVSQAQAADTPAQVGERPSGSKDERVAKAFSDYEKQRFDAAALEFEGLWQEFKEPRFLFNAAVSRVGARHHAHAVAYLSEYVGTAGLAEADRAEAEAQRTASLRETVAVRVQIEAPADRAEVEFSVQHVPKLAADIRPPLVFVASQAEGTSRTRVVDLDPGDWKVIVKVEGFEPVEQRVQVTQGAQPVVRAALVPVTTGPSNPVAAAGLPDEVRRKFVKGASIAGGVVLVGGIGAMAAGLVKFNRQFAAGADACAGQSELKECRRGLSVGAHTRGAGAAFLGAGIGGAVAGLSGLIRDDRRRRTAWLVEASVGGVAAIGGAVLLGLGARKAGGANTDLTIGWDDPANQGTVKSGAAGHSAGAAVLGFGAGLLIGGVSGLVLERAFARGSTRASLPRRGLQVGGGVSPAWSGVVVSGRF